MTKRVGFPWPRFGIAALMVLIFYSAGAFVGFGFGLVKGVDAKLDKRIAAMRSQVYPCSYRVHDLWTQASSPGMGDLESQEEFVSELMNDVCRDRWEKNGGPCSVGVMPGAIVIFASSIDHEIVRAYIEGRRKQIAVVTREKWSNTETTASDS
ncbi:hypothetical protein [Aporhodopirellula aestuarii]|uniref:Uncharacterized protein n=1 Tax=Aporhodopirellula aestuarii TaxID=2950107 RepID=A0ABT0TZ59_9BACT|nr:hypothetical protein [Aporhodopirellula aestuarii]MCM2369776.1 hypothetical protein [Aporhodopirellula aestuarii]